MSETPMTEHVRKCVKVLIEHLYNNTPGRAQFRETFGAVFELLDMPWEGDEDPDWREGYETCMTDVADAIAQAWGVELPRMEMTK